MRTRRRPRTAPAQSCSRATSTGSKRHHQLADGAAIAECGDGLTGALERIGAADSRSDVALAPPAEQLLDMRRVALGVAREKPAPEHAAHVAALEQSQVERQPRDPCRETNHQEAAFPSD